MYLSAPSDTVARGHSIAVGVHVNSGDNGINAVQANLSYASDRFEFVSITPSSVFPVQTENSGGGGAVHISRGTFGSVKGDKLIATVTFKAKTVGTTEVNFTSSSSATQASDSNALSVSTSGAQYTVTDPSAPARTGSSNDTAAPKISDIRALNISYNSVKLGWTTSEPSQSEINFGSTTAYGISEVDSSFATDHSMTLSSEALMPATMYHFKITSKDTEGNTSSSSDKTFTTKGAVITVKVTGSSNQVLAGATVTVDKSNSQKTDQHGRTAFSNLPAGTHDITATFKGKTSKISVETVIPQNAPQSVVFKLDVKQASTLMAVVIAVILGAIALGAAKQIKNSKIAKPLVKKSKKT